MGTDGLCLPRLRLSAFPTPATMAANGGCRGPALLLLVVLACMADTARAYCDEGAADPEVPITCVSTFCFYLRGPGARLRLHLSLAVGISAGSKTLGRLVPASASRGRRWRTR